MIRLRFSNAPALVLCMVLAVPLTIGVAWGQQTAGDNGKAEKIDALLSAYTKYHEFNGAVLVAEKGNVILRKGYGLADMEWSIPNTPDTKFRLGSVSKQFTAVLILKLVEQGKLTLDGKVSDYLPYYRKDTGSKITIEELLAHTAGLPNYTERPDYTTFDLKPYTPEEFVKQYCSGDLQFEPGSKWAYSNTNYFVLGAIIEQVTGKPYKQVLREEIFQPLGMEDSGYDEYKAVLPRRARGYTRTIDKFENASYFDSSVPYAAGSLYSTVNDLYKWDQALYTEAVLPEKYKAIMFHPRLHDYALGWFITSKIPEGQPGAGTTKIWHPGGIDGFMTLIERFVNNDKTLILLNNTGLFPQQDIQQAIEAIMYDKPYKMPKMPMAEALEKTLEEKGAAEAIAQYHELKKDKPDGYDFGELQWHSLSQLMQQENRLKDGLAIIQCWVEEYPKSPAANFTLAEAYLISGDKQKAAEVYKKVLEFDPSNPIAAARLKQVQQ
jgi:CubicO group peptidase (beta-lactamase class C family)